MSGTVYNFGKDYSVSYFLDYLLQQLFHLYYNYIWCTFQAVFITPNSLLVLNAVLYYFAINAVLVKNSFNLLKSMMH
jgi:hypothetical protein